MTPQPETQGQPCYWSQDDYGGDETWETSCGNAFVFDDGGPKENAFAFCGYCGKPLVEQRTSEDAAEVARRDAVSAVFRRKVRP